MASLSFSSLPPLLTTPALPAMPVGAISAVTPVALLQAEFDALPLPQSHVLDAPAAAVPAEAQDGAAMRPDQLVMARQLVWPGQDGGTLAGAWRSMVRNYGTQMATREQQGRAGQLPTALLLSGQDPRMLRQADLSGAPGDAWRFTVHAGARDQHLRVVENEGEHKRPQGERRQRRRARAGLQLELVLADGSIATVLAEPLADGIRFTMYAPDPATIERLRILQPELETVVWRAGMRVLGWKYVDKLPEGPAHARLPTAEAASALNLPVFRAMAELALLLPARLDGRQDPA
jgi:hypothetical protein